MNYRSIEGDVLDRLPELPTESADAIVTDPPYELGFMGKAWDSTGIAYSVPMWQECLRVLKPGAHLLAFGGARTYHRMACAIEDAGFEVRDQIMWLYGSGFPKSRNLSGEWNGWGTALKPAHEPIVLARKPFRGTVAANVLAHGTGAINVEACRIGTSKQVPASPAKDHINQIAKGDERGRTGETSGFDPQLGRWPANVIHDGSDEVVSAFPDAPGQCADIKFDAGERKTQNVYGAMNRGHEPSAQRSYSDAGGTDFAMLHGARRLDAGSAARFFYCAKASSEDRHAGLSHPGRQFATNNTPRRSERVMEERRGNHHPTVKPTELMQYLCRLVTPPGGTVLDPFMGSGSTGRAALLEGFNFIGIEVNPEYVAIARRRLIADVPLLAQEGAA